jgi:putative photosynthetic complex assembly protein
MSAMDTEPFPRGALIAAAALLSLSVGATALVRMERVLSPPSPFAAVPSKPVASIDLGFADQADGSVSVRESGTGRLVTTLTPGTNAFVRGVVRGLAQDRRRRGIGTAPPFRLSEIDHGQLFLEDTATGRVIDLQAFGISNHDAFKAILHPGSVKESEKS